MNTAKTITVMHTESSKGWGGQEVRTFRESVGLMKLGVRIVILCQPGSVLGEKAEAAGITVKNCLMKKSYDVFAVKRIMKLIQDDHIDVINTHSGRDTLLAGIAGRLSGRKPAVVRTRHLALPITSTFTYKHLAHKIVTVSAYVRNYLISEGIPSSNISAVHTCVDLESFNPDRANDILHKELELGADTPIVGVVSILRRKKGHHILMESIPDILKEVPEAVFVLAGNGPQEENITNRLKELGLSDKVYMLGLRNDVPDILKSIDVFVLPTLQEALGTSFIEAMAMGKPVIGSDVGGVGELIKDGENGYLVKPDDPSDLAGAIIKVLTSDDRGKTMGAKGRKIAEQDFSVDRMCEEMYNLYVSLLQRDN
jgi:glycosyltransferase involved in cell wall biosynthesis